MPRQERLPPFCSLTQGVVTAATGAGITIVLRRVFNGAPMGEGLGEVSSPTDSSHSSIKAAAVAKASGSATLVSTTAAPPAAAPRPVPTPPHPDQKPAHDVVAGAMARAASQSTIHPLDTMKVRMQAGRGAAPKLPARSAAAAGTLARRLADFRGLYKGVVGAATGAGIIIGTYFAFYSTTKRYLREHTDMTEGATAFVAGAAAAVGSSVVKVPLAVCIRSVQAGVYANALDAAKSIVAAAGVRGLFTGFLPTLLEDVPDMAVKFAVYETLRQMHSKANGGRAANVAEDLCMGGVAGAAAAAATTPLDVLKTVMMCSASSRPTVASAARQVMGEGRGLRPFWRGVGPRALSNGLNSAIFFCFFEMIRQGLIKRQHARRLLAEASGAAPPGAATQARARLSLPKLALPQFRLAVPQRKDLAASGRPAGSPAACLTLALPAPGWRS